MRSSARAGSSRRCIKCCQRRRRPNIHRHGAVLPGAADHVQGVHKHGVVLIEGGGVHAGSLGKIFGLGGVVEETTIADCFRLRACAFRLCIAGDGLLVVLELTSHSVLRLTFRRASAAVAAGSDRASSIVS
jgi:hypothetical protein